MTIKNWTHRARRALVGDERGQTLVEYALIIAVISIGLVAALGLLRTELVQVFSDVANAL